jgi:hypothetical protein
MQALVTVASFDERVASDPRDSIFAGYIINNGRCSFALALSQYGSLLSRIDRSAIGSSVVHY